MNVGELVGYLEVEDRLWNPALRKAEQQLHGMADRSKRSLDGISGRFAAIGASAGRAVVSLLKAGTAVAAIGTAVPALGGVAAMLASIGSAAAFLPAVIGAAGIAMATLKIGTAGLGDAMKAVAEGDAAELAEAIKGMPAPMQDFVREVAKAKPLFDALQDGIQASLFFRLGEHVRVLSQVYLPSLSQGATRVAGEFNYAARSIAAFLADGLTVRDVRQVLADTGEASGHLADSLRPLVQIALDLAAVGSDFLPGWSEGLGDLAQKAAGSVREMRETGQLRQFFIDAASSVGELAFVLRNVKDILTGVFGAADVAGTGLLANLERITGAIADAVNSVQGQDALAGFFVAAAQIASVLLPLLVTIAQVIGTTVAPALAQFMINAGPGLSAVVMALADAVGILAPALAPLGEAFSMILTALSPLLPALAEVAVVLAEQLAVALVALVPHLPALVQAIIHLLMAVVPLVPSLVELAVVFLPLIDNATRTITVIAQVVAAIVPLIAWMLHAQATIAGPVVGALVAFGAHATSAANTVIGALSRLSALPGQISGWFGGIPGRILIAFAGLPGLLLSIGGSAGRAIVDGVIGGIQAMLGRLAGAASSIASAIGRFLPGSPVQEGPLRVLNQGYAGRQIVRMVAGGLHAEGRSLGRTMDNLLGLAAPAGRLDVAATTGRTGGSGGTAEIRVSFDPAGLSGMGRGVESLLMELVQRTVRVSYAGSAARAFG